jgi:hypothetical protein
MDLDSALEHDGLGLLIDVVEHLIVNLQRLKQLLVRVLEGDTGQIWRDLALASVCPPLVWRP